VENQNRFTLIGKDPVQYVVLFLALAALAISLYAFIACLRTKMGKRKWLWAILCFAGMGRLAVNWTTGATGFTAICIGVPPVGAAMVPLYSPWMVYTSLPVGAVLFLIFRELVVGRPAGPVNRVGGV
jgi:drug/metabolite transporter (DMT)-like permease